MTLFFTLFSNGNQNESSSLDATQSLISSTFASVKHELETESESILANLVLLETCPELVKFKPNLPEVTLLAADKYRQAAPQALADLLKLIEDTKANPTFDETAKPAYRELYKDIIEKIKMMNDKVRRAYYSEQSSEECVEAAHRVKEKMDMDQQETLQRALNTATPPASVTPMDSKSASLLIRDAITADLHYLKHHLWDELCTARLDLEILAHHPQLAVLRPFLHDNMLDRCEDLMQNAYAQACRKLIQRVKQARDELRLADQAWLGNVVEEMSVLIPRLNEKIKHLQIAVEVVFGTPQGTDFNIYSASSDVDQALALAREQYALAQQIERGLEAVNMMFRDQAQVATYSAEQEQHVENRLEVASEAISSGNESYIAAIALMPLPAEKAGLAAGGITLVGDLALHVFVHKCVLGGLAVVVSGHALVFVVPAVIVWGGCAAYNYGLFRRDVNLSA